MPKEKEDFREILARLSERYPDDEVITLKDACLLCKCSVDAAERNKCFPKIKIAGRWKVPLVGFARYLSTR